MVDQGDLPLAPAGAIDADSVATRRFLTGVRGYVREEVHAFLRAVADALRERDARIAELETALAAADGARPQVANAIVPEIRDLIDSAERLSTGVKLAAHAQMLKAYRQGTSLLSVIEDARARFEIAESAIADALHGVMDSSRGLVPPTLAHVSSPPIGSSPWDTLASADQATSPDALADGEVPVVTGEHDADGDRPERRIVLPAAGSGGSAVLNEIDDAIAAAPAAGPEATPRAATG